MENEADPQHQGCRQLLQLGIYMIICSYTESYWATVNSSNYSGRF